MSKKQDAYYFNNFAACADCSSRAAHLLKEILTDFKPEEISTRLDEIHEIERVANVALENVAAQDVLVGRRHYNPCVGLLIYYVAVCPGNGGRGSEPYGFGQDVAARKVGKLALHDVDIVYKRRNINMIRLDETRKTFVCELK